MRPPTFRPIDFNPLDINPLRDVVARLIDFEKLRASDELKLFISATCCVRARSEYFAGRNSPSTC